METSVFLARLFAVLYLSVGLGMMVSRSFYEKLLAEFATSRTAVYLGGAMALAAGMLMLRVHSVWRADWSVVLTWLAWAAVIKGILLLVVPEVMLRLSSDSARFLGFGRIFALVLGVFFAYFGFFAGI